MAQATITRIPSENLGPVNDVIFGDGRRSGPVIADRIGTIKVTLWSWLNRRGMPVAAAKQLEREMARQVVEMDRARRHLAKQIEMAER